MPVYLSKNLHTARRRKNDEFYTQLSDIENELQHYQRHFTNKVVYCNCDDPKDSNFSHYFLHNFERLGLKKLLVSGYKDPEFDLFSCDDSERATWLEYEGRGADGKVPEVQTFKGDGDFRSNESIELLSQADIVVTNPPFSLFREYVAQLVQYNKKFLIMGSLNAVTHQSIFPLFRDNRLWLGITPRGHALSFVVPDGSPEGVMKSMGNVVWFTNLDHEARRERLPLHSCYTPEDYPTYDNYEAINVDRIADIPLDWNGVMGVPITFFKFWNPKQFDILGISYLWDDGFKSHKFYDDYDGFNPDGTRTEKGGMTGTVANGNPVLKGSSSKRVCLVKGNDMVYCKFKRIFIRRKDL